MLEMLLESTETRCILSWMRMNLGRIACGSLCFKLPAPRLLDAVARMIRDADQHFSQIGFGFEAVESWQGRSGCRSPLSVLRQHLIRRTGLFSIATPPSSTVTYADWYVLERKVSLVPRKSEERARDWYRPYRVGLRQIRLMACLFRSRN
jgi:hypothetical protein